MALILLGATRPTRILRLSRIAPSRIIYHGVSDTGNPTVLSSLVSKFPECVQPYLHLIRLDRPIGTWLLFCPCGWSLALATPAGSFPDPALLALFAFGSFVMRGAGCTINDLWDKDIDSRVQRTKTRPITSGQITVPDAISFLSFQLATGLSILLCLNYYSVLLGASSLGLVIAYPLMKRFTHWPQLFLGLVFNWGTLLGWTAVHESFDPTVCIPLYIAGISWTLIYDTIYALQDKVDDSKAGIKSTAVMFGNSTKKWLTGFSSVMMTSLILAGLSTHQMWPYYVSIGYTAFQLGKQTRSLDISNPDDCGIKFVSHKKIGLALFFGICTSTWLMEASPSHVLSMLQKSH